MVKHQVQVRARQTHKREDVASKGKMPVTMWVDKEETKVDHRTNNEKSKIIAGDQPSTVGRGTTKCENDPHYEYKHNTNSKTK